MKLDSTDIAILKALQKDSNRTVKSLAEDLKRSTTPVFERIKKLEREGYIKGYSARLNQKKLGLNIEVMLAIKLNKQHRSVIADFIKKASQLPGVIQLFHIAGDHDFVLHVAVKDSDELRVFILDRLSTLDYIQSTQTTMVLHNEKVHNIL